MSRLAAALAVAVFVASAATVSTVVFELGRSAQTPRPVEVPLDVLGPIDISDLRRIRESVINLNLAVVIDELSDRGNSA